MTEPEPEPCPPASKKPRGCRVELMETTPGEMARKTSMLFCSSVATDGSATPAMVAVAAGSSGLKAAAGCCRREPQRSKHATLTAAKTAERNATAMICRADILYMALLSDDFISCSKKFCKSDAAGHTRRCAFEGECAPPADLTVRRRFYYEVATRRVHARTHHSLYSPRVAKKFLRGVYEVRRLVREIYRVGAGARRAPRAAASRGRTRPWRRVRA